jgi:hypothetical protein
VEIRQADFFHQMVMCGSKRVVVAASPCNENGIWQRKNGSREIPIRRLHANYTCSWPSPSLDLNRVQAPRNDQPMKAHEIQHQ